LRSVLQGSTSAYHSQIKEVSMKLLAVETATQACSAALYIDGQIRQRFEVAPQQHTKLILPMIDSLMNEAGLKPQQLDGLAFSRGPGSFTGVRIATGIIQGIAFGADLPVVPVSTLAALAQNFFNHHPETLAFTGMDARMSEIFWGVYEKNPQGFAQLVGEEAVTPATEIIFPQRQGVGLGSAWAVYQTALTEKIGLLLQGVASSPLPEAAAIAQLGVFGLQANQGVPAEYAMPVYLRDKVAKKESER
jgi:tRNA threonylcarbamoyladenosine biosynthesis protein TsaB